MDKAVVWLASYPKSGNTWMRLLLANLLSNRNEPISINDIELNTRSLVRRTDIEDLTLIDTDLLTPDESLLLRARIAVAIIAEAAAKQELLFVKTHDAYCCLPDGTPFLGQAGPRKAIYVVRDPRDVAVSLSFHMSCTVDKAIEYLSNERFCIPNIEKQLTSQLPQHLLSWSNHVTSWIKQQDVLIHIIRYEDLREEPFSVFSAAVAFLGIDASRERIEQAIRFSDFATLQEQEIQKDFCERHPNSSARFFREGRAGGWIDVLTERQSATIVANHQEAMMQLGYLGSRFNEKRASADMDAVFQ